MEMVLVWCESVQEIVDRTWKMEKAFLKSKLMCLWKLLPLVYDFAVFCLTMLVINKA